jgi:hypothetical protein
MECNDVAQKKTLGLGRCDERRLGVERGKSHTVHIDSRTGYPSVILKGKNVVRFDGEEIEINWQCAKEVSSSLIH